MQRGSQLLRLRRQHRSTPKPRSADPNNPPGGYSGPGRACKISALTAGCRKASSESRNDCGEPDYKAPWNSGAIGRGVGAGFVIDGKRIMTNAHVVSNARYLTVERDGDPNKYPAKVLFVAHDCDLALITVASPQFLQEHDAAERSAEFPSWNRSSRPTVIRSAASACR